MKINALIGSSMATGLLGLGILAGSIAGANGASAQTSSPTSTAAITQPAPKGTGSITAAITQAQAEQAALAANAGSSVDHTRLGNDNGTAVYDVDFANGGGAQVDAQTGKVIASEAAGADQGGRGPGGGADQAALAAKATVTQAQAEQSALAANAGSSVDHSRLGGDPNGTVFWDVDFSNGGGARVDAQTGKIIDSEAAGADHGGHMGGPAPSQP